MAYHGGARGTRHGVEIEFAVDVPHPGSFRPLQDQGFWPPDRVQYVLLRQSFVIHLSTLPRREKPALLFYMGICMHIYQETTNLCHKSAISGAGGICPLAARPDRTFLTKTY